MPLPDTVNDHPRGQRLSQNPFGKLGTSTACPDWNRLPPKHLQPASGHDVAKLLRITSLLQGHICRLSLGHCVGHRKRRLRAGLCRQW